MLVARTRQNGVDMRSPTRVMVKAVAAIGVPTKGGVASAPETGHLDGEPVQVRPDPFEDVPAEAVWYAPQAQHEPRAAAIRPLAPDSTVRPLFA